MTVYSLTPVRSEAFQLFYNTHTSPSPHTAHTAGAHTHKRAAHAAAIPYENCRYSVHLAEAKLAQVHELDPPSPSYQSDPNVWISCAHVYLHKVTFSNYQRRLQDAILSIHTLKVL